MSDTKQLAGKVALVTGASKGIGAGIAKHLAAAGASVVVNYASSKSGAERVVTEITAAGGKAVALQADVSQPADITRLIDGTKAAFGRLDILVNNAGVYEYAPLEEITLEQFRRQFDLNVLGLLLVTKEAVKLFPESGGSVINISSAITTLALAHSAIYSGTKGAVDVITKVLSAELGPRKIRVNAINPGMVETEGVHAAGFAESDLRKKIEADTPLGRIGQPADIAPTAVFLASDGASWLSGEIINVAGGLR